MTRLCLRREGTRSWCWPQGVRSGSSRDWAAKGTVLLGVTAVIAESFERIHRSNLVGMGVIPLQFPAASQSTRSPRRHRGVPITGIEALEHGAVRKRSRSRPRRRTARVHLAHGCARHPDGGRVLQERAASCPTCSAARRLSRTPRRERARLGGVPRSTGRFAHPGGWDVPRAMRTTRLRPQAARRTERRCQRPGADNRRRAYAVQLLQVYWPTTETVPSRLFET